MSHWRNFHPALLSTAAALLTIMLLFYAFQVHARIAQTVSSQQAQTLIPLSIGDFVWLDLDTDGQQDIGEPGISDVAVQLWNGDKTAVISETVTDANGFYTLVAPAYGSYHLRILLPSSATMFSPQNLADADDTLDSDVYNSDPNLGFTDVLTLDETTNATQDVDAGIIVYCTPTPTPTPTFTPSPTPTLAGNTPTTTATASPTLTPSPTATMLFLFSCTQADLIGFERTATPTPFDLGIFTPTPAPTDTLPPLPPPDGDVTHTLTPTATFTATPMPTLTPTLTPTGPTPTRTPTPINVGNFVWDDMDEDGRQDAGEPGIPGVTVQLWNSSKTFMIAQTVTGASGQYTVVAPLPGDYRIRVVLSGLLDTFTLKDTPDDLTDSDINAAGLNAGFTDTISIATNVISITNIDAGINVYSTPTPTRTPTPINIGNFVWDDIDKDGRQDAGEPGLSGITVQLWNETKTWMIDQSTTNGSGHYTVVAPIPGNYRIRVILSGAGDTFSPKDQAGGDDQLDSDINEAGLNAGFTDTISIASNVISTVTHDTGVIIFRTPTPTRTPTPINIGNYVWHDRNGNGQQDASESGLAGVTVQLWNASKTWMIDSAVTDANGRYTVTAPIPGNYRIRVIPPDGDIFSPKDQAGGDDQLDSDINPDGVDAGFTETIVIPSNVISTTIHDAGIIPDIEVPAAPAFPVNPVNNNICGSFRLTAPLDGLPNGPTTFYWDPVSAPDVTYEISVFDDAGGYLTGFSVANQTSVSGDVSQGAIGGAYQLFVRITASVNGQVVCTDERGLLRVAPPPNGGGSSDDDEPVNEPTQCSSANCQG